MAVSAKVYGQFPLKALNKEINYLTDTVKVMLCTSTYVPDQDAHVYKSSVTNEITGTGYTAGGQALTSKVLDYTGATNVVRLTAASASWASSTLTARYAVVYVDTGTASTSPLISYVDFGQDISSSNGPLTITWDTNGIATLTAA